MEYNNDCNIARMTGLLYDPLEVDHTMRGETIYTGSLAVERSSGTVDILPLAVPGRLLDGASLCGALNVRAQIRSYNQRANEANRLAITLFARYIEEAPEYAAQENDVTLAGTLCKPAVFRTTPFMREIADMLIAVNRAFGRSDYIPCIAWGRDAHFAANLEPGAHIRLQGRLQSREYIKKIDNVEYTRTAYEVSCRELRRE